MSHTQTRKTNDELTKMLLHAAKGHFHLLPEVTFSTCLTPTWWYSERMLCISSTSSLEISFNTKVRSYDVSSSLMHCPSSSLSGGLRARDTCWLERGWHQPSETFYINYTDILFQDTLFLMQTDSFFNIRHICVSVVMLEHKKLYFTLVHTVFQDISCIALVDVQK